MAECLRQIVPNRWASVRKRSFRKCCPACIELVECSFCFERLRFDLYSSAFIDFLLFFFFLVVIVVVDTSVFIDGLCS